MATKSNESKASSQISESHEQLAVKRYHSAFFSIIFAVISSSFIVVILIVNTLHVLLDETKDDPNGSSAILFLNWKSESKSNMEAPFSSLIRPVVCGSSKY